ncbi:hypothetical protein G6F22_012168 [Rhizopus arrhizus]|nr:hypothetical protein G6F22_012168 [Rhizopus arrhizus]
MTAVATRMMWRVLSTNGISVLEACLLVLFVGLFAWIALSFASALAGFLTAVFDRGYRLGIDPDKPLPTVHSRTALLMPTYNEDPRRLLAGLQAIYESVAATGQLERFDFFVLSDTRREDIARAEEQMFAELRDRVPDGQTRLFYRRRGDNSGRKAGNIADWVRRFGGAYPQMLILDADSLMTGDSIVRLVAGMEHNADVGLIQTLPSVIGGRTLFARMQQFGGRVYGPVIARGVAWWHGAESNYWGHNAIIRTRAFADHAGLPALPGRKPFGGHVLSHDFVEAALMRRGGWAAHMVPYLGGSYEEGPPTLTDLLPRPALDQPHPHADRHRPLLHRADVGDADADRHRHPVVPAGHRLQRPAAPVAQRVLAGPGRGTGGAPVRRHHGRAAAAQGAGLPGDAAGPGRPARLRGGDPCVRLDAGGNRAGRADGPGSDVRAVARRGRSAVRPRLGLGRTAARRRWHLVAGADPWLRWPGRVRRLHGRAGLGGIAVAGGVDGAGGDRHGAGGAGGGTDLLARPGRFPAPPWPA